MDAIMRAVKAIHSVAVNGSSVAPEDLERQRMGQDLFSKLVTPGIGVHAKSVIIESDDYEIPAEWVIPDFCHEKKHLIMYCHGGGYTCGSLKYARVLASKLSLHTGMEVLAFEYRLAPENMYPAALNDARSVWDYIMKKGYGARDVILAGDSAGGNLALELCLTLKKEKRFLPKALILMSPWTDMTMTSETYVTCKDIDPMLTREYINAVRGAYAGHDADFSSTRYSPLFADFTGFPPTLIQVGENEILLGDSEKLAEKMRMYGTYVTFEKYEECWHVFQQMPIRRAYRALENIGRFITMMEE